MIKKIIMRFVLPVFIIYLLLLFCHPFCPTNISSARQIIAHRGAAGMAPENTLASIKKAMEFNPHYIEFDIHQTKDSVLVVIHDKSIDRTSNGEGNIRDLSFKQLRKYDFGEWYGLSFKNERIPTLDEVLSLVDGKTKLLIEIKGDVDIYPAIADLLVKTIHKHKAQDWCAVHSFNDYFLQRIHALDPSLELHKLLFVDFPYLPFYFDNWLRFGNIDKYKEYCKAISLNRFFINGCVIARMHEAGLQVNVWTVNDSSKILELFEMGVDGVITDYPHFNGR